VLYFDKFASWERGLGFHISFAAIAFPLLQDSWRNVANIGRLALGIHDGHRARATLECKAPAALCGDYGRSDQKGGRDGWMLDERLARVT
jgi:hypothetical protein